MSSKRKVEFIGNSRGVKHGETAEVSSETAKKLIREGLAREPRKAPTQAKSGS